MSETIFYIVEKAEYFTDNIMKNGEVLSQQPSNDINPRTIKSKTFKTYEEAIEYADKFYENIKSPENWKWVAHLRISKCIKEPVKIYKECDEAKLSKWQKDV